jgi:hypothetical protein
MQRVLGFHVWDEERTVMNMTEQDAIHWAFLGYYHQDKANACMHCAPVRFSPITFRLAEVLSSYPHKYENKTQELAEVNSHRGRYAEDPGR